MSSSDEKFMLQALKLAEKGIGSVEPNPAVGAVLVKGGRIIGKGWHKKFGGQHAEINALENCRKNGNKPAGAAMYVTVEPCCHHGKTPPCTEEIIKNKIAKVVIAMVDPSKHASGKGIDLLKKAGIEVETGLCEKQAQILNAPFIKFAKTGRCWVTLKWAQTIDGKLAFIDQSVGANRKWISNEKSRKDSHRLRQRVDAILIGINTVIADDPLLTPRPAPKHKKIIRIVLDGKLRIPPQCQLLKTAKNTPLIVVTAKNTVKKNKSKIEQIKKKGAEILFAPLKNKKCNIGFVINRLSCRGVQQLLVEGGPAVITSFLKQNLADELVIYIAKKKLGKSGSVKATKIMEKMLSKIDFYNTERKNFDSDIRIRTILNKQL